MMMGTAEPSLASWFCVAGEVGRDVVCSGVHLVAGVSQCGTARDDASAADSARSAGLGSAVIDDRSRRRRWSSSWTPC